MKKLLGIIALSLGLVSLSHAEFNRVGNQATVNLQYVAINAPQANDWQGVQLTNTIPLGVQSKVFDQVLRFNTDLNAGYVKSNEFDDKNFGSFGVGVTSWANFNFDKSNFSLAPYLRLGVTGNSGNMNQQNHQYWAYQIEPGLVAKVGAVYGLVAYKYGEAWNSDFGSVTNDIAAGVGINLTKSWAVEARYDWNRGSHNLNTLGLGVTYKF